MKHYNKNIDNRNEETGLRSENSQRFITEEPPFIIRHGILIIVLVLSIIVTILHNFIDFKI